MDRNSLVHDTESTSWTQEADAGGKTNGKAERTQECSR